MTGSAGERRSGGGEEQGSGVSSAPPLLHPSTGGAGLGLGAGGEFDLIRRFFPHGAPEPRSDVVLGPGDDCAVVAGSGIALSSDISVEGIHFRRDWLASREIGYRAAAAALSDLAAVGARPIGVLASLAVPQPDVGDAVVELMAGVAEAAARLGGVVLGGDVTRSPGPLVVDVTVVGEVASPVTRSGARVGDEVWVTGELGAAGTAVAHWLRGHPPASDARQRFAAPLPRTREARWLAERGIPTAMIDLSDGLAGDAGHIAAASRVALVLEPARLPIHPAARADGSDAALHLALTGGEDYELLFTAAPGAVQPLVAEFQDRFAAPLTRVGAVRSGAGVLWNEGDAVRPLPVAGFQHFHT